MINVENMKKGGLFTYFELDVGARLPTSWKRDIISVARAHANYRTIVPTSVTSRESRTDIEIPVATVGGRKVKAELPWLYDLYRGIFREIGQECVDEPLAIAQDDRYAVNLNVQTGNTMRYECHVDSNPLEGLLYATSHLPGAGGELVVSNEPDELGPQRIKQDSTVIYPESGKLMFFDARSNPHYVSALKNKDDIRVVVAMNYYTPSCSEAMRPKDLNLHLFDEP